MLSGLIVTTFEKHWKVEMTLKFCIDCKHHSLHELDAHWCTAPQRGPSHVNLVTGSLAPSDCYDERKGRSTYHCTEEGAFWEDFQEVPKIQAPVKDPSASIEILKRSGFKIACDNKSIFTIGLNKVVAHMSLGLRTEERLALVPSILNALNSEPPVCQPTLLEWTLKRKRVIAFQNKATIVISLYLSKEEQHFLTTQFLLLLNR